MSITLSLDRMNVRLLFGTKYVRVRINVFTKIPTFLLYTFFFESVYVHIFAFSPFSHNVFNPIKDIKYFNPFPNKLWFLRVCSISLLKTMWDKEKLLVTSNVSFSHSVFYPFGELSAI